MTVDWTKPIQTKSGISARVLTTNLKGRAPIAVAVTRQGYLGDEESVYAVTAEGHLHLDSTYSPVDIINAPEPKIDEVVYVNIHEEDRLHVNKTEFAARGRVAVKCRLVEIAED